MREGGFEVRGGGFEVRGKGEKLWIYGEEGGILLPTHCESMDLKPRPQMHRKLPIKFSHLPFLQMLAPPSKHSFLSVIG